MSYKITTYCFEDYETKMGRIVAQEHAELKKMENLKQKLNPIRIKRPNSM